jgi:hypothetical protein
MLRQGATCEVLRDILGHANIDEAQNIFRKSWWEERSKELTDTCLRVFAIALSVQNA